MLSELELASSSQAEFKLLIGPEIVGRGLEFSKVSWPFASGLDGSTLASTCPGFALGGLFFPLHQISSPIAIVKLMNKPNPSPNWVQNRIRPRGLRRAESLSSSSLLLLSSG